MNTHAQDSFTVDGVGNDNEQNDDDAEDSERRDSFPIYNAGRSSTGSGATPPRAAAQARLSKAEPLVGPHGPIWPRGGTLLKGGAGSVKVPNTMCRRRGGAASGSKGWREPASRAGGARGGQP